MTNNKENMMDNITNPNDIVLTTAQDVISTLEALKTCTSSPLLEKALDIVREYHLSHVEVVGHARISSIIGKLSRLSDQNEFKFSYTQYSGKFTLTIDDVFSFAYRDHAHVEQLVDFIRYVLRDVPAVMECDFGDSNTVFDTYAINKLQSTLDTIRTPVTAYKKLTRLDVKDVQVRRPSNELPTEVAPVKDMTAPKQQLNSVSNVDEILTQRNPNLEVIRTVSETHDIITPRLTAEQIDEQKQANIDHLRTVKENIDNSVATDRAQKMKYRIGEMADGIGGTSIDAERLRAFIENWLADMSNTLTMSLFDFIDLVHQSVNITDPMITRLLIQVCCINRHHHLLEVPRFIETPKTKNTYMQLSTKDKELLVGITLNNLDLVEQHKHVRDYGLYQLAIYVIDLCNKSSSLTVTENPEEIVSLTIGVYNILLSKNLNGEFVYAADVNNQYDVDTEDWFLSNKVVKSYLERIENISEGDKQSDIITIIESLIESRDRTMTTPRLDTERAEQVFDWASKLPHKTTNEYGTHMGHHDTTYVITGDYPTGTVDDVINFKQTVIVATHDAIAVFVKPKTGGLTQEFYSTEHASRLVLWLEYFLPTHIGEF